MRHARPGYHRHVAFPKSCRGRGIDAAGRRHGGHGRVHPSHSIRGRARGHPPAPTASHPYPHDARYHLRSAHRHGLRRQAHFLLGRQSRRGLAAPLRDAYEKGWPAPIAIEEHSHAAMANAYAAGASGLPFAVFRGYLGVDLPKVNPNIKRIVCPFTGEELAAVPAIRPDVAVIHALRADRAGNVLIEGIVGVQKEIVLAAKRSIVTVEEIVDDFGTRSANAVILPSWTVGAIACVPGGAHPSYAHGYYKRDNAYYKAWDAISRDRDAFLAWMKTNVLEQGPEAFAVHCSRLRAAAE